MRYDVTLTLQAKQDLKAIYRYIAVDLASEINANRLLDRLEENILKLDTMPERFRIYDREPWRSRNLRVMPIDHYLVFYVSDRQTQAVTVLRVMYGGRDVAAQLERNIPQNQTITNPIRSESSKRGDRSAFLLLGISITVSQPLC